jgi:hypothetical protein
MSDLYYLEKNVLTAEECSALIEHFKDNSEDDYRPGYKHSGLYAHELLLGTGLPGPVSPIRRAIKICHDTFTNNYIFKYNRFDLKRLFGNIMSTGAFNEAHDDDGDVYPDKPATEEHYSAVLMLNSDYEGGELFFQHHDVEIRLEAGDLIMFRGNAKNLHGVREITSGERVNVIIFFRNYPSDNDIVGDLYEEFVTTFQQLDDV